MKKRLTRQEKIDRTVIELINQMFIIAGHSVTYDDIKDRKDSWYTEWTMTEEQYDQWKDWGTKHLSKHLGLSDKLAEREMSMVGLMWGLKIENLIKEM